MTRLVGATALMVVALTTLALAGCAQEPETVATPTATPSPTETVELATRPNPVFAIDCAGLLTLDEVQARVSEPVSVKRDESNVPASGFEVEGYQRGGLSCLWGGENRTDSSFDDGVSLLLLPNGVDEFTSRPQGSPYESVLVVGADSAVGDCFFRSDPGPAGAPGTCRLFALIGTTLAEFTFSDSEGAYLTEAAIGEVAIGLLETAIARMVSAGPRDQEWTPPALSLKADSAFCDQVGADLTAALGTAVQLGDPQTFDGFPGVSGCVDWGYIGVVVVSDAAWVAGATQTEPPALGSPFESRTTATGAVWWLSPSGESVVGRAAVGGSLVDLFISSSWDASEEQRRAAVEAFMEKYAEVPPGS